MPTPRPSSRARGTTATAAREQLTRLLGLSGDDSRTSSCPTACPTCRTAAERSRRHRDAAMAASASTCRWPSANAEATASALGLSQATRFVNVLDAGYANKSETGEPRENGYEIALELPLFDWGGARTGAGRSDATCSRCNRTAETARSGPARKCARRTRPTAPPTTWRATTATRSCRCARRISDEILLRYNGMLVSVFELLADAREQVDSVNAAIDAQRDFWIAETDLQAAINGAAAAARRTHARSGFQHAARPDIKKEQHMASRRNFFTGAGASLVGAGAVSRAGAASLPEAAIDGQRRDAAAAAAAQRPALQPGRHAERLDAALAHEGRRQGIPPGRRAGRARDRARHEGEPVGLQRPAPGPDHRGGRRRPRAHLRHQQAARAHQHPLARPAPAERHGRRDRPDAAAASRPARPSSTSSSPSAPAPSCTTRTPTRWCRWRWA